jgi:hypothetical protein
LHCCYRENGNPNLTDQKGTATDHGNSFRRPIDRVDPIRILSDADLTRRSQAPRFGCRCVSSLTMFLFPLPPPLLAVSVSLRGRRCLGGLIVPINEGPVTALFPSVRVGGLTTVSASLTAHGYNGIFFHCNSYLSPWIQRLIMKQFTFETGSSPRAPLTLLP